MRGGNKNVFVKFCFCFYFRNLEEALEMGMDWSLREGMYYLHEAHV